MVLSYNELNHINGGCIVSHIIRTIRIHIKYIIVKYFI